MPCHCWSVTIIMPPYHVFVSVLCTSQLKSLLFCGGVWRKLVWSLGVVGVVHVFVAMGRMHGMKVIWENKKGFFYIMWNVTWMHKKLDSQPVCVCLDGHWLGRSLCACRLPSPIYLGCRKMPRKNWKCSVLLHDWMSCLSDI